MLKWVLVLRSFSTCDCLAVIRISALTDQLFNCCSSRGDCICRHVVQTPPGGTGFPFQRADTLSTKDT